MAYTDAIETLKTILDGYSTDSDRLQTLYRSAMERADADYKSAVTATEKQYRNDRNEVYADVARDERNAFNVLASRGLGFSGEAAQTKLNSNILLAKRLSALSADKDAAQSKLATEHGDKKHALGLELAEKQGVLDSRAGELASSIADLELERESESEKLAAEKEMLRAELKAKYGDSNGNVGNNGSNGSNDSNDSNGSDDSNGNNSNADNQGTSVPSVEPKELAKLIVGNATNGSYVNSAYDEYRVNKYMLDLVQSYSLSEEYLNELIFMLKAYGYSYGGLDDVRIKVISYDAAAYYKEKYSEYFDKNVLAGSHELMANMMASESARNDQLDYVYRLTDNESEFRKCCESAGIPESLVNEYIETASWGSSGKGGSIGFKGAFGDAIRKEAR